MENKTNILLVDDEPDFLEVLSSWLQSKGYTVTLARNGQEAVDLVKSLNPNMVFLDIRMPVMDGIEALTRIRKFNKEIPVIMLTAYGDKDRLTKAEKLGISGFFPKNNDLIHLTAMIGSALRAHKNIDPHESSDKK